MKWLILALVTATLAGCADLDDPAEPAEDPHPAAPATYNHTVTIDWLAGIQRDTVQIKAFRIAEPGYLALVSKSQLSYSHDGASYHFERMHFGAPVPQLLARSSGDLDIPIEASPYGPGSGGGGGCSTGIGTQVRVEGHDVTPELLGGCSAQGRGSGGGAFYVENAMWVMTVASSCGVDPDAFDDRDVWQQTFSSEHPIEIISLPATYAYCGIGFDDHAETIILGDAKGPASARFESPYGAVIQSMAVGDDEKPDGTWATPDGEVNMTYDENDRFRYGTWTAGAAGFDVDSWADFGPSWFISGI